MLQDRIRTIRKSRGLTQAEFGKVGGVSLSAQNMYEKGERDPTTRYLENLAEAGFDVAYVVSGVWGDASQLSNRQFREVTEEIYQWLQNGEWDLTPTKVGVITERIVGLARENPQQARKIARNALKVVNEFI